MGRILFAWELGGGYGHVHGFLPVALTLRERGHEVIFALRDVSNAGATLDSHGFTYLQAPLWLPKFTGTSEPASYAEILFAFGYLSAQGLQGMVGAWRHLFEILAPDLLVVDHSPTALLASRGLAMPCAMIGNGFCCPPATTPLPCIRPGTQVPQEQLTASEQTVLGVANRVLAHVGAAQLAALADLFHVDETFLCTWPELDQYAERVGGNYWGPQVSQTQGAAFAWPEGDGARIFAYLKPAYGRFEAVLQALCAVPARVVVHAPSMPAALLAKYQRPNVRYYREPVNMKQAADECDAAVCHGGSGATSSLLLDGRPMLLLPMHVEQYLFARRVVQLGAGIMAGAVAGTDYRGFIERLLADPDYAKCAQGFAQKHAGFDAGEQATRIAMRCEELMAMRR
jgi:UDP:flavonoid glycosyltransferase YjiC (YdhE family)